MAAPAVAPVQFEAPCAHAPFLALYARSFIVSLPAFSYIY